MRVLLVALTVLGLAACASVPAVRPSALRYELPGLAQYRPQTPPDATVLAPRMALRQEVLRRAARLLGTPYVWGGNADDGLDCSSYVSAALQTARRHTTDTLLSVSSVIAKEQLLPGDLLNLETWDHPTRAGHVRMFAAWADAAHTKMWVFEERYPQGAIYHVVSYDARYLPLRYDPLFADSAGEAALISPAR